MSEISYCKKCLTPSTRPRVAFNSEGVCNACSWAEKKKNIDWTARRQKLVELCDEYRGKGQFDVLVPCSGGKDGSYVAWKMKHEFGMHPLCITVSPPMQTELGRQNLENFRNSGFDLVEIRPNPEVYRRLCKRMFIDQARAKFPFVIAIGTAVSKVALALDIPLVIYGEEGETEYGGKDGFQETYFADPDYVVNIYHEGNNMRQYLDEFTEQELGWWLMPETKDLEKLRITWWSKYENWDDQLHRDLAIKECGLQAGTESGTFTTHSQIDDKLQSLHMYECFLKFGHGRATGDVNLAIHGGRMTREEGVRIVNEIDGTFPLEYLNDYLKFFDMPLEQFWAVIDSHANKELLQRSANPARPWILKRAAR